MGRRGSSAECCFPDLLAGAIFCSCDCEGRRSFVELAFLAILQNEDERHLGDYDPSTVIFAFLFLDDLNWGYYDEPLDSLAGEFI